MFRRAAIAACLLFPAAALAAPATSQEAARLTSLFETYVGAPMPGAPASVVVTPQGDGYKASFDLARMAAPLHGFGIDVVATSPYVATLTPLPDGTWRVERGAFPQFGFTNKKGLTYSIQFLSSGAVGIFDPKIEAFAHQENQLGGNKTSVTFDKRAQHTELSEQGKQLIDAKGPGPGDVTSAYRQDDTAIHYQSHTDAPSQTTAASPLGDVTMSLASAVSQATASHERVAAMLDLWAFLVAHPSRDQLVAEQSKLKSLVLAMIPYVSDFAGRSEGQGLSVSFAQGSAKVGSLGESIAYDGSSATEGLALSLKMSDLAVSTSALPSWIVAALPHRLDLNLATSPLDVSKALRVLVERADIAKDDPFPADAVALALAALAPNGGPTLAVKPSTLANDTLSLSILGAFSSGGAGKAKIQAKGLDEEIAALGKASAEDPMAAQAVQLLAVAKALAVPGDNGGLLWEIVTGANGLAINGKPLQ